MYLFVYISDYGAARPKIGLDESQLKAKIHLKRLEPIKFPDVTRNSARRPHSVAFEPYVKAFQYKILNSILFTNA